jgi:hypothetical protein
MLGTTLLLACAVPARADAPPGATLTLVPPNETKIVTITPVATTTTVAVRAPAVPSPVPAAAARAVPAAVAADAAALRAQVEASAAERRRLSAEIDQLDARIPSMDDALAAAQGGLATRQAAVDAMELLVDRAGSEVETAGARLAQLQVSAATAADAAAAPRTPVARPPAPGHTPQDAAASAGQALVAAVGQRAGAMRALAGMEEELDVARRSRTEAAAAVGTAAADVQGARDAVAGLRRQLAAAGEAAPVVPTGAGSTSLVPAPSGLAAATVPPAYLSLYGRAAAACPGMPWTVLAAVGAVESGHGQSTAPGVQAGVNVAGAMGPMQFLAGTWAAYGVDGDGDGVRNVYDPDDAVFGAANYLCASGAGSVTTLRQALWDYNHADWYVDLVLDLAARL